jgi:hypothetical protein
MTFDSANLSLQICPSQLAKKTGEDNEAFDMFGLALGDEGELVRLSQDRMVHDQTAKLTFIAKTESLVLPSRRPKNKSSRTSNSRPSNTRLFLWIR